MKKAICHLATLRERYLHPEEVATKTTEEATQATQQAAKLAARLQELGIDPHDLG